MAIRYDSEVLGELRDASTYLLFVRREGRRTDTGIYKHAVDFVELASEAQAV